MVNTAQATTVDDDGTAPWRRSASSADRGSTPSSTTCARSRSTPRTGPPATPCSSARSPTAHRLPPRHGRAHHLPPHRINYRANLWALRSVGVRQVLGPCAVGGLRPEYGPGTLLIPDQFVDRTKNRVQSYYDGLPVEDPQAPGGERVPEVVHVSLADPYCPVGRKAALRAAQGRRWDAVDGGTLVVVEGPRFSTRAESLWHRAQGWSVVGMTGHPEAALARELELCYTSLTLVTDLDAGAETGEGVSHDEVLEVFAANIERLRAVLFDTVAELPAGPERGCLCARALGGRETGIGMA
ncbi:S-methyl-5'-thioadenosine phosphorylase [Actinomadura keratinilytica]